ncbi:MAG TPA: RodZ domain-containing protein [Rhizomicrobium sp.]|jgi:cytoskeleton protein RodZ
MTKVTHLTLDERGELSRQHVPLHDIPGVVDSPLETVGKDLRTARLRRGEELAAASRALRIRRDHLEAIEEDRFEALPGRTYAVGFVRTYAAYLGLDPEKCVERFKEETAGRVDGSPQVGLAPEYGESRLPRGWLVMGVIVAAVAAYGAWHLAQSADRPSMQPVAPVPARIATAGEPNTHKSGDNSHAKTVVPATQPSGVMTQKATAAPAASSTANAGTATSIATTLPKVAGESRTATAPSSSSALPTTGSVATAGAAVQTAALPTGQVLGAHEGRVVLHVRGITRILIEGADGKVFINRILHPGDTYRVPNLVGLSLTTPDGGAVSLELDGRDMGIAGQAGEMTEALSLDPQAVANRSGRRNPG